MTVKELINKLNTIEDKSITVTINPYVALHDGGIPQAIRPYPITGVAETYSSGVFSEQGYKKGSFNLDINMRLFDNYQPWMDSQEQVSAPPKPKKTTKSKRR
jgi:hypothetical protein